MTVGKVLVLGDDTRSFLATVRSLGRRGLEVHVVPWNFRSPALRSRYIAAIHDIPPWMADGTDWLDAMEALLRAEEFDLVVPCNETGMLPLQHAAARFAPHARLAISDNRSIEVLFDKHATRELARAVDVPVARGRLARADDDAGSVLAELGAPVVVKPRQSYSLDLLAARGSAQVVDDPIHLGKILSGQDPDRLVLESFFPGRGAGVSVLSSRGRLLQAFQHHRVRERNGASYYRVSAAVHGGMLRACEAICSALSYTGVAMFEFKLDTNGKWILLEVNARPWGSMPLPLALGVDFPYRWYRLLMAGEETPSVAYRTGVYGRNLVPDLRSTLSEAQQRGLGPVTTAWSLAKRLAEMWRVLAGREVHDVMVRDDPRPGFAEIAELGDQVWQRLMRELPHAAARQRQAARAAAARALREPARPRVVFVCSGNICRSPFAAALMRAKLGGDNAIEIESAGTLPRPDRQSPAFACEAAASHGIELAEHRSVWLSRKTAESASLLVTFDRNNTNAILDRYPDLKVPIISLGELTETGEINDPDSGDLAQFRHCYQRIAEGVGELAALSGRLSATE